MNGPVRYRWSGEAMVPLARFARRAASFVVGQVYDLEEVAERSKESHNHFFACVHTAWLNLPEMYADRFGDDPKEGPEKLRKWCLIKAGFSKEHLVVATTAEQAERIAALAGLLDPFAVVLVDGTLVRVMIAKTQKLRRSGRDGMDKREFEASKEAVLRECSKLIGTDVVTLLAQSPSLAPEHAHAEFVI
jgi:hypothetical protein